MMNFDTMTAGEVTAYRARVAAFNDQMRAKLNSPAPDIVVMTTGILTLVDSDPRTAIAKHFALMRIVAGYDDFSEANDPHGERDFGAFEWAGTRCFWKIDYYDRATKWGSPNPSDPKQTCRVLTVLRADEY